MMELSTDELKLIAERGSTDFTKRLAAVKLAKRGETDALERLKEVE